MQTPSRGRCAGAAQIVFVGLAACVALGAQTHVGRSLAEWRLLLDSSDRQERLLAIRAVGEMAEQGWPDSDTALVAALDHEDSAVRYWAAVGVGLLDRGAARAETRLLELMNDDPAAEVRVQAAYVLAGLGHDGAVERLAQALEHPNQGVRLYAAHALDALGEDARAAVPALQAAVSDEFDYVRRVSRHALWALGERACPYEECD